MNALQFSALLRHIRSKFLVKMAEDGFWYRRELRHDPIPWDINNGLCDQFADAAHKLVPNAEGYDVLELDPMAEVAHVIIKRGRTFYDAENVRGVSDWRRLPIFQGRSREQAIEEMGRPSGYRSFLL